MFTLISPFSILQDKGLRLEKNGKYQEAAEIYRELSETIAFQSYGETESRKAMLQCAINLRRTGKRDNILSALQIFNDLLRDSNDNLTGQIMREKAILLIEKDRANDAIKLLDKAFPYFYDSDKVGVGSIFSVVAKANSHLGQKQQALDNFKRADSLLCNCNNIHELNNIIWWINLLQHKDQLGLAYRALKLSMTTGYSIKHLKS